MANRTPNKTTLKKGDNLPPRGKGKKSLMLEAIRSVCGTEQDFLKKVIKIGLGDPLVELAPNPTLLTLVLGRIEPPLKSVSPMVEFEFDTTLSPHEKADQILTAIADGKLAPDIGQMIINSIQAMLKIQEITDIDERLKTIEELANNGE